jgi:predicted MFS family arabinose efflux permease
MSPLNSKTLPWRMWALPLAFFAYQFVLRLWPSLLMPQIMEQLSIDATAFGLLSAVYYFGYAGMQIPIAIFLDRYGPKVVVATCALVCGLATLLFTFSECWLIALLGRFLIGAGSAAGFLGASKAVALWFPRDHYSRMIGLTFSFGLLGALYGGKPLNFAIDIIGWKQVATLIAFVGILLGVFTFLLFKNPPQQQEAKNTDLSLKSLAFLFRSPSILWLAVANLLMVGALEGFADVWGINYLIQAYQLTKGDAAGLIAFVFIGMLFGGPILAYFSNKSNEHTIILISSLGLASFFLILLLGHDFLNGYSLSILFFFVGILCCYQVIVFALGTKMVDQSLLSVTVALLNCINMLGGSFFHTLIGCLMDVFWTGDIENGTRIYSLSSYFHALQVIPCCALVGGLIIYLLKRRGNQSILSAIS